MNSRPWHTHPVPTHTCTTYCAYVLECNLDGNVAKVIKAVSDTNFNTCVRFIPSTNGGTSTATSIFCNFGDYYFPGDGYTGDDKYLQGALHATRSGGIARRGIYRRENENESEPIMWDSFVMESNKRNGVTVLCGVARFGVVRGSTGMHTRAGRPPSRV